MKKLFLLLGFLTIFIASCTQIQELNDSISAPPDTSSTDQSKICDIFSTEEIESILEKPFYPESTSDLMENAEGCKYIAEKEENRDTKELESLKNINFIARTTETEDQAKEEYFKAVNTWQNITLPDRENKEIKDVGTLAFLSYHQKTPQLVTYQNNKFLIITFGNFYEDAETILPKISSIAEKLFERL